MTLLNLHVHQLIDSCQQWGFTGDLHILENTVRSTAMEKILEENKASHIKATIVSIIQETANTAVYRALLKMDHGDMPIKVVLKFGFDLGEARVNLQSDAAVYTDILETAQGTAVPIFYGLFERTIADSYMGCMVLEDCGNSIENTFPSLPDKIKIAILKQVTVVHKLGYTPLELLEQHVLRTDSNEYRLIDFHQGDSSSRLNKCTWNGTWESWYRVAPIHGDAFGCDHLLSIANDDVQFWINKKMMDPLMTEKRLENFLEQEYTQYIQDEKNRESQTPHSNQPQ